MPPLYFNHTDGTLEPVPVRGPLVVYYMRRDDKYEAFPPGFRMIAGDAFRRNSTIPIDDSFDTSNWKQVDFQEETLRQRAVGFICLGKAGPAPEGSFMRHGFPAKDFIANNCHEGIRVDLAFPSCWNGKDLDSPNHRDHMAYDKYMHTGGPCPESHPIRLPQILYEIAYDTTVLSKQPGNFIWANGDTTGFGYHADFMTGWDPVFLKRALEECKNNVGDVERLPCNLFTKQDMVQCKAEDYMPLPALSREVCTGRM